MAAVLAAGPASASHRTAGGLHSLDGFRLNPPIEVMVFDRRGLNIPNVIVHRPRVWLATDRCDLDGIPVTSVCRTLFDLAAVVSRRRLQVAFDDAIRRGLTTLEALDERLEAVTRPGVPGLRQIAKLIGDRSTSDSTDSELETEFRDLIADSGLPAPAVQYEIRRDDGTFVARVDFAYPAARIAIEMDSWKHHGGRDAFHRDRIRQNELVALGWTPLRFTKADMRSRRRWVASLVERHLSNVSHVSGPA